MRGACDHYTGLLKNRTMRELHLDHCVDHPVCLLTCLQPSTQSVQVFSSKREFGLFCMGFGHNLLILNECGYIVGECLVCKKRVISRKSSRKSHLKTD